MSTSTKRRRRTESIYEKAARLLVDETNITTIGSRGTDYWIGVVTGDHDRYACGAVSEAMMDDPVVVSYLAKHGIRSGRVWCNCKAGRRGIQCAHSLIAEEKRCRGGE